MTFSELKARVDAAEGADREIDGLIAQAFGFMPDDAKWSTQDLWGPREPSWVGGHYGAYTFHDPEPYTSSLDAALGLVEAKLPGWGWQVRRYHIDGKWRGRYEASIWGVEPIDAAYHKAPTPSLALLSALLSALIAEEEEKP